MGAFMVQYDSIREIKVTYVGSSGKQWVELTEKLREFIKEFNEKISKV